MTRGELILSNIQSHLWARQITEGLASESTDAKSVYQARRICSALQHEIYLQHRDTFVSHVLNFLASRFA